MSGTGKGMGAISIGLALALFSLVVAGPLHAQGLSFLLRGNFATGAGAINVAVGDFNGDARPDLAVANIRSDNVSVLLGNGDGTFQPAMNVATGSGPASVAVGNFNGDARPDLAVTNFFSDNVSVLLGNGDGTFRAAVKFAAGIGPVSIAVGDLNGDGKLDLAVANQGLNDVSVLLGNGDGSFQAAVHYGASFLPESVAVADLNGDGKPDLAVASYGSDFIPGDVSVLLGNGDGTFRAAVRFRAEFGAASVTVGNFNGDGKPDLAVANFDAFNVSLLLGNGDGTFQPAVNFWARSNPISLAVGDFNGDGKPDLAVANQGSNNVSVLLGNGDGTFQTAVNFGAGNFPSSVAVGDFNRDGKRDLAVANYEGGNVSVLLNNTASPDPIPPTVSITSPTSGSTVSGTIPVSASASDNVAVAGVQFQVDGNNLGAEDTTAPYSVSLDTMALSNGSHTLTAVARDTAGNTTTSSPVTVTVSNGLMISGVSAGGITTSSAVISWTTNLPADSQVEYGTTIGYGQSTALDPTLVTAHSQTLSGLLANTSYHYRVKSRDGGGNPAVSGDFAFTTLPPAPGMIRDDFTLTQLDPAWTFTDPLGNSSYSLTANPGHLQIGVPAGSGHDCWGSTLTTCARMLRSVNNGNATYETKIDGVNINTDYQAYGIMLYQDSSNFMRFEYMAVGSQIYVDAYITISGSGSQAIAGPGVTLGASNYLRVTRSNNSFKLEYSGDGVSWKTAGTFSQAFTVNKAGLYVINAGRNPATTANFDYFGVTQ